MVFEPLAAAARMTGGRKPSADTVTPLAPSKKTSMRRRSLLFKDGRNGVTRSVTNPLRKTAQTR
jgi:hypothetical protein